MRTASVIVLVAAGLGLVAGAAFFLLGDPAAEFTENSGGTSEIHAESRPAPPTGSAATRQPFATPGDRVENRGSQIPDEDSDEATDGDPVDLPPAGRLRLAPVDYLTRLALPDVEIRMASDNRFALLYTSIPMEVQLSAGRWTLTLSRPGYEPLTIEDVDIRGDEITDLEEVALVAGESSIEGRVLTDAFLASSPRALGLIQVELRGHGRHPCTDCGEVRTESSPDDAETALQDWISSFARAQPCMRCGYSAEVSHQMIRPGDAFAFRNLAGGRYLVSAYAYGHNPVGDHQEVELAPTSSAHVNLALPGVRDLHVRVLFRGGLFQGSWVDDDGEKELSMLYFDFFADDRHVAEGVAAPKAESGEFVSMLEEYSESVDFAEPLYGRADWQRLPTDVLHVDRAFPVQSQAHLEAAVRGEVFVVEAVPSIPLVLQITCGPLASPKIPLDLVTTRTQGITATLDVPEESSFRQKRGTEIMVFFDSMEMVIEDAPVDDGQ